MATPLRPDLANRFAVLATYRHLIRAIEIAFKGDKTTNKAARQFARDRFRENRSMAAGSPQAAQGVEHAQGVAQILRENVVQGKYVGTGK